MLIERINQEASQNKRPPDEATHPATGQIYVNVGPMLASTGDPSVDARLGAVMVKVATKAIGKIRNMSIFQVGDTPAREILDAKGAMGFHVEGKVQELKVTKAGATTVSCKVQLSLTGYADKALLAVADGGASVQAAGSAPDIGLAGEDCVSASVEDLMAKHVIPAIPTRTAPKTQ
jgi:hypothetical protein